MLLTKHFSQQRAFKKATNTYIGDIINAIGNAKVRSKISHRGHKSQPQHDIFDITLITKNRCRPILYVLLEELFTYLHFTII